MLFDPIKFWHSNLFARGLLHYMIQAFFPYQLSCDPQYMVKNKSAKRKNNLFEGMSPESLEEFEI